MPHLVRAQSHKLVSRMLVSLAAGHKSNGRPAFKVIARRNQQSYEAVEFVELSFVARLTTTRKLARRTVTLAAVAELLYLPG